MIDRILSTQLANAIAHSPAVALLGPRQVGKTTLALEIGHQRPARALGRLWAIEIKRSLAPKVERGFYAACADLKPARKFVVYPGQERYHLAEDVEAISLADMAQEVRD